MEIRVVSVISSEYFWHIHAIRYFAIDAVHEDQGRFFWQTLTELDMDNKIMADEDLKSMINVLLRTNTVMEVPSPTSSSFSYLNFLAIGSFKLE